MKPNNTVGELHTT